MCRGDKLQIAIDCRMIGMSGIGVYLKNIVPEVIRQAPQFRFILIGPSSGLSSLYLPADADVIFRSCKAPIYSICEQILIPLVSRGADLLWIPHYNIPIFTKIPLVTTIHDVAHLVLNEVIKNAVRLYYAKYMFDAVRYKSKEIICVSRFTANEFMCRVGVPKGGLHVIYNGVDDAWLDEGKKNKKEVIPPYFIAVGNLKQHKRIDMLCRVFSSIKETIPHHLILIGKHKGFITGGQSIQELIDLAPDRIVSIDSIDTPDLREMVHNATALVFPSSYEGFGLPPLEALATGVPVIAADIPPVREVCGNHAAYFKLDDERDLAEKLIDMAQKGKRYDPTILQDHATRFSWERAGCDTIEVLKKALKNYTIMR